MKVRELIEQLESFDPEDEVLLQTDVDDGVSAILSIDIGDAPDTLVLSHTFTR